MISKGKTAALTAGATFGAALLTATGSVGVASYFARRLVTPERNRRDDATIVSVDLDAGTVTFKATPESRAPGRYGLYWDQETGHARIGDILTTSEDGMITRSIEGITRGTIRPGRARWSSYYVDGPPQEAWGIATEVVDIPTQLGPAPAWVCRAADPQRWAILVHGRGARRNETLRALPLLHERGINVIVPSYRNDEDGPPSPDGRYGLGLTEWADIEEAARYVKGQGATAIELFGWSMGGAIVMQFLDRSELSELVSHVVLDGPVLSWADVISHHASMNRLHPRLAKLASLMLETGQGNVFAGVAQPLPIKHTDWVARAAEVRHRILIIHSVADKFVPYGPSAQLGAKRPDLVSLHLWDRADHVREWNTDPQRWERVVAEFLDSSPKSGDS